MTGVVIDTSAAVAVLLGEADAAQLIGKIDSAGTRLLSAASYVELGIVLESRFGPVGQALADRFVREGRVTIIAVDTDQASLAIGAYRRFGKGNHPAGLNFGDCFTYALAEVHQLPVLFVGEDFSQTDLPAA